jgi:hypothetical protein
VGGAKRAVALRLGLIDHEVAAVDFLLVQRVDRGARFVVVRHFHKAEAAGTARAAVNGQARPVHLPVSFEQLAEFFFGGVVGEIADVNVYHDLILSGLAGMVFPNLPPAVPSPSRRRTIAA